jgi:serine/threonine protein kinase
MSDLSGVFSCSTARSWSYLPIFDEAIIDPDPYRSRNTVAHTQRAYQKGFFKTLVYNREVAEGSVFAVALYENTPRKQLFAVKKPKFVKQAGKTVGPDRLRKKPVVSEGVYLAFKEIQIISHNLLREHINIVDIIGWDWASDREPAIIVEYAKYGTLQEFLQEQRDHLDSNERRQLCLDVACGLSALHATDVAHGDIKTTNVLVFRSSKDEWLAKLSDFSHAMFGLSLQRKTTYPGSGVYNAPEIRKRDVLISSDKVPCCEAFSFGLLVWEVLLDGVSFWHGNSIVSSVDTSIDGSSRDGRTTDLLNELPRDELLKWAQTSLHRLRTIRPFDKPLYSHIFDMTLQDRPWRRKDLATLATRLDEFDRYKL